MFSLPIALPAVKDVPGLPAVEYHLDLLRDPKNDKSLDYVRHLQTHLHLHGLGSNEVFASHLVLLFIRYGSLHSALQVFLGLRRWNVFTWNCLLEGYVEYRDFEHALDLYQDMQDDGAQSDRYTFQILLKACAGLQCAERGREVHDEIAREGFDSHPFMGSALLDMYVKCGALADALDVFQSFSCRDVVMWTALISGYSEHGQSDEALSCWQQMREDGISPNAFTFVCTLKGCENGNYLEKGKELNAGVFKLGLEDHAVVLIALADMYAKCGALEEAQFVFDALPRRCVISWTALISGFSEEAQVNEAFELYERMKLDGVSPNEVTAVCCLKGCGIQGNFVVGQKIHLDVVKYGFEKGPFVGAALIDFYVKCGCLASAVFVHNSLTSRNVVCWNALLAGYAEKGLSSELAKSLESMVLEGITMDVTTFIYSIKACNKGGSLEMGFSVHLGILKEELEQHPIVGSALVDMYASCGYPEEAQEVLDELAVREVVAWSALIAGYVEQECGVDALTCYEKMQVERVLPNTFTYVSVAKACGCEGALDRGHGLHAEMVAKGLDQISFIGGALIDMYTMCCVLEEAQAVFDGLPARDVVLWSAWIAGCARAGDGTTVIEMFEKMKQEEMQPEDITFSSVLAVCSHEGLLEKGLTYFESMVTDYKITPTIEHSNCLIDLVGRAGQLSLAIALLERMPEASTPITWNIVLSASKKWGSKYVGQQAFENALRLNNTEEAAYYLMSGIYADAGMWAEAKFVVDALKANYVFS